MTDITSLSKWELTEFLWDWCKWNAKEMSEKEFISRYGTNPITVYKLYFRNPIRGITLQDVWLEFIKKRRER